jgi:LysR family nod box-dependent transcriptional activator
LRDRWLCAVWTGNSEVADTMTMEIFERLPHLIYSIGAGRALSLADEHLARAGVQRRIRFRVESFLVAPFLLTGTSLTTLVPERTGPILEATGDIRLLDPPIALPKLTEALWWHPRHTLDPAHMWLRTVFESVAAELRHFDVPREDAEGRPQR